MLRRIALVAVVVALSTTACGADNGYYTSKNTDPRAGKVWLTPDTYKQCDGTTLNYWNSYYDDVDDESYAKMASSVPNSDECKE